ncbi:MAG: hypothetical protein M5U25_11440 [Planctomycetota bacterium]|nr:hypothetical protein [Planctomycetota bacterium]
MIGERDSTSDVFDERIAYQPAVRKSRICQCEEKELSDKVFAMALSSEAGWSTWSAMM